MVRVSFHYFLLQTFHTIMHMILPDRHESINRLIHTVQLDQHKSLMVWPVQHKSIMIWPDQHKSVMGFFFSVAACRQRQFPFAPLCTPPWRRGRASLLAAHRSLCVIVCSSYVPLVTPLPEWTIHCPPEAAGWPEWV